ncbi:putative phosphotransmitter protein Ypd1 [Dichotomocladium elegans]|nr:putative phosphotransmitter protein Ypd1 [Dichotomocladium elegans]
MSSKVTNANPEQDIVKPESTMSPSTDTEESAPSESKVVNPEELIDMNTFDQLLDMDDEEDHEFSFSIVTNYFEQAETTFKDMDDSFDKKDLAELSRLGHFLKGSSAAIGLKKVKDTCEKIQNIGNRQDDAGAVLEEADALKRIKDLLPRVKEEYKEAEEYLKNFYEVQDGSGR